MAAGEVRVRQFVAAAPGFLPRPGNESMKIETAYIDLVSQHALEKRYSVRESLVEGISGRPGVWGPEDLIEGVIYTREEAFSAEQRSTEVALRDLAEAASKHQPLGADRLRHLAGDFGGRLPSGIDFEALREGRIPQIKTDPTSADTEDEVPSFEGAKVTLIRLVLEALTGKKIELISASDLQSDETSSDDVVEADVDDEHAEAGQTGDWGLRYSYSESYTESEQTSFYARGIVKTTDGEEIEIEVSLNMARRFASQLNINIQAGAALKDPLVINFSGTAAQLTETRFSFDIDVDGSEDQIAFVRSDSGLLAADNNGDGVINNGSELFGALTGDGFQELAQHDEDGNGFIDEGDSIYNRLRIWTRDGSGENHLFGLSEKGVGAIYLGYTATPFEIKDQDNQLQGAIRSTGVYLGEDGAVGTVQQVDLVV